MLSLPPPSPPPLAEAGGVPSPGAWVLQESVVISGGSPRHSSLPEILNPLPQKLIEITGITDDKQKCSLLLMAVRFGRLEYAPAGIRNRWLPWSISIFAGRGNA